MNESSSSADAAEEYTPAPAANDQAYNNVVEFPVPTETLALEEAIEQPLPAAFPVAESSYDSAFSNQTEQVVAPAWELAPTDASPAAPLEVANEKVEKAEDNLIAWDPTIPSMLPTPPLEVVPIIQAEKKEAVGEDILASYKERFGINPEDLEGIEGFDKLSRGQQRQVLENLQQITIGRIREDAVDGQAAEVAEKKANAKFLGKVWIGVKDSFTKKFEVIGREKKMASEIQNGGINEHKAVLLQMVKGMKDLGPAIKEGENGELEMQLIETDGMNPELAKIAEVFNQEGTKFSKIPHEWGMETATPAQQKAFKEAEETYRLQRTVMMNHMAEAGGDEMAVKAMAKTESVIEMQRFMQTCPDAVEELKGIEDQSVITAGLKSVGAERGYYAVGGALARTAIAGVVGIAAAPIVAAASAGIRGWKRSGEALLAQDKAQRAGETVETEKMKLAQSRIAEINIALANLDDERVKASLTAELGGLSALARGTTKNMIEAVRAEGADESGYRGSVEKINALVNKLKQAEAAGEDTTKLASQLKRRIDYTNLKIAEGKMVFGDKNERLGNQYALTSSMSKAEVTLASETATDENGDKAERRLEKMLGKSDAETADARFKQKAKQALVAGGIGFVAAGAGMELADAVKWMNGADGTLTEKAFGKIGDVKESIGGAYDTLGAKAREIGEQIAAPYAATEVPVAPMFAPETLVPPAALEYAPIHLVTQGESLSKIFGSEIPSASNVDVMRVLKGLSPAQLKELGVSSGNPDVIVPGDTISVEKMKDLLAHAPSAPIVRSVVGVAAPASVATPHVEFGAPVYEDDIAPIAEVKASPDVQTYMEGGRKVTFVTEEGHSGTSVYHESHEDVVITEKGGTETMRTAGPITAAEKISGAQIEGSAVIPERPLSEVSRADMLNWPKNKVMPWAVTEQEASNAYGPITNINRQNAEAIKEAIGRYPNTEEYRQYISSRATDPIGARRMIEVMKVKPLSANEVAGLRTSVEAHPVTPVAPAHGVAAEQFAKSAEVGETPIKLSDLSAQERIRFGPAIRALTRENGGKFPDGISADKVVQRQLDIESQKGFDTEGYGRVPRSTRPKIVQQPEGNATANTVARAIGAAVPTQEVKGIAGIVAAGTEAKGGGFTGAMKEVSTVLRGTQNPTSKAVGAAITEIFRKT